MKNKIAKLRSERGLTQRQLAEQIGIHYQALQRYENNSVIPSIFVAIRLARALNTTVEELFVLEEE